MLAHSRAFYTYLLSPIVRFYYIHLPFCHLSQQCLPNVKTCLRYAVPYWDRSFLIAYLAPRLIIEWLGMGFRLL